MKKLGMLIALFAGIIITLSFEQNNDPAPVAIIELFTSQGCSSCPSADKLLSELSEKENVLALSFHVSYWNYLGWKDPYSSEQFTERQRTYAKKLHLNSIYTPQMIVNGTDEFVGSSRVKAEVAIKQATSTQEVQLQMTSNKENAIVVNYKLTGSTENEWFNIALVEKHVKNEVPRGENQGKVLEHDNVVRVFKILEAKKSGSITITLPEKSNMQNAMVIAYIQRQNTFEITGADKLPL